jgi:hypothetical protein
VRAGDHKTGARKDTANTQQQLLGFFYGERSQNENQ